MFIALAQDAQPDLAQPLAQYDDRRLLVSVGGQPAVISNVCTHQGSRITDRDTDRLQCPYHGWRFDLDGRCHNHAADLARYSVYQVAGMLFDREVNASVAFDVGHMRLWHQRRDPVPASVDKIMDVFLDIDHIPVVHEGVYDAVGLHHTDQITTACFDQGSVQSVQATETDHMVPADQRIGLAAQWLAVYPGTMIEWQPGILVITVARDTDPGHSQVHVFQYVDTRYQPAQWQQNLAIWEQAWQQDCAVSAGILTLASDPQEPLKRHHRQWISDAV